MTIYECPRCKSLTADTSCDCLGAKDPDPLGLDGFDPATKQFDATLDCRTPVGRQWIARQHEVVAALSRAWNASAIVTPDTEAAAIDVLFAREGHLVGLAEIKCRTLTLDGLRQMGSYLITHQKLQEDGTFAHVADLKAITENDITATEVDPSLWE